ncbi:MAG: L-seryl-tRNA(Sec) selenium transferase [Deltaproteobacteria bacterium]|nr:L-seryl-tRNA(Sec) selenium transferase [Deltaproteobacteria bacterium]
MSDPKQQALRGLPSVDELLHRLEKLIDAPPRDANDPPPPLPRWALVAACRDLIAERRQSILANGDATPQHSIALADVLQRAQDLARPSLEEVLNATGVVIHTNLGRAPLAEAAIDRLVTVARGYSTLEYDLETGARGNRHVHAANQLCALTGAKDAAVVNNNAGAVMLALAALAHDRDVIVSRGELIEIGGSFRIPDVMTLSGAHLVEVGTTNRTHISDYENAITAQTGLLFKAHQSNFAIVGFTKEVEPEALVRVGREAGIKTLFDLGSGTLTDLSPFGLGGSETPVDRALAAGFDLVTFSGDKLLGGPQAGILVGTREAIEACRRHPLMRALRPDKLALAALDATLTLYREGRADTEVPVIRMLKTPADALEPLAKTLHKRLSQALGSPPFTIKELKVKARAGGGSYPTATLDSWAVALRHGHHSARDLNIALRQGSPPIIARIEDDKVLLDVRTLSPADGLTRVVDAIAAALVDMTSIP